MLSAIFTFIAVSLLVASIHPVVCQRWEVFERALLKSVAFYILLTLWFPYENWVVPIASALVALLTVGCRWLKLDEPTMCRMVGENGGRPVPKCGKGEEDVSKTEQDG